MLYVFVSAMLFQVFRCSQLQMVFAAFAADEVADVAMDAAPVSAPKCFCRC